MAPSKTPPAAQDVGDGDSGRPRWAHQSLPIFPSYSNPTTKGLPNRSRRIEELPIKRGAMITLQSPPDSAGGDCLTIHPELDANLPEFHPNIYIPARLLDYPEHLVKFGGGGSGVTVFGGYHPLLGPLVMKHGGYKDLIELVSLAKIEREMGVRFRQKTDHIVREGRVNRGDEIGLTASRGDEIGPTDRDDGADGGGDGIGWSDHPAPNACDDGHPSGWDKMKENLSTLPRDTMISMKNSMTHASLMMNSMTHTSSMMNSMTHALEPIHRQTHALSMSRIATKSKQTLRRKFGEMKTHSEKLDDDHGDQGSESMSNGRDGEGGKSSPERTQAVRFATEDTVDDNNNGLDDESVESKIQAIQFAVEDMKWRIPAFRMIYISPMHVRERKGELVNSAAYRRRSTIAHLKSSGSPHFGLFGCKLPLHLTPEQNLDLTVLHELGSVGGEDERVQSDDEEAESESMLGNGIPYRAMRSQSSVMRKGRTLRIFGSPNTKASSIDVGDDYVNLCFGGSYHLLKDQIIKEEGEDVFKAIKEEGEDANDLIEKEGGDDGEERGHYSQADRSDRIEEEGGDAVKGQSRHSEADGKDGYASLMAFVKHLCRSQQKNEWKITLGQQTIGRRPDNANGIPSQMAPTASSLLTEGKLHGPLLHHLIDSQIRVIRNLQLLTMPEEEEAVESVRAEYDTIMSQEGGGGQRLTAADVSNRTNEFVGKAIHKNFHPITGRFVMLHHFGQDLFHERVHLKPQERLPAKHLENLFRRAGIKDADGRRSVTGIGTESFEDIFIHSTSYAGGHPILETGLDQWRSLLELSLSVKHPNATRRIWTCGLTDGGLHNMFLSESQMWLFDLGEPSQETIPAFLTKFLMSFYHALGMEEDERGDWVVRFEKDENSSKLRPTRETKQLLFKVGSAFNVTMDRIIQELFGGEEAVRVLLLRYVVTQLISDAAFCVDKWRTKGGGDEERSEHQYFLEKWLWRALWDVYVSEEVRRRYLMRKMFQMQRESRGVKGSIGLDEMPEEA